MHSRLRGRGRVVPTWTAAKAIDRFDTDRGVELTTYAGGDTQAREQLIEQYLPLVRSLARRYSYRGEQLEDSSRAGQSAGDKTGCSQRPFDRPTAARLRQALGKGSFGDVKLAARMNGGCFVVLCGSGSVTVRLALAATGCAQPNGLPQPCPPRTRR